MELRGILKRLWSRAGPGSVRKQADHRALQDRSRDPGNEQASGSPIRRAPDEAALRTQLDQARARIRELEKLINNSDQLVMRKERELKQALNSYQATLIKENPDILPELLQGETVEALNKSLARARELTEKVRSSLEAQAREIRIPAGAPERTGPDIASLSATEKIKEGLNRKMK